ncbi:hypothetical protein OESDEN_19058 [Oesophagostomum dentatum]|uniref:Uncharacterized protein n=1 Tax=Oesophagostomum dentatum TaxID=61180 RepID=A0A0B1SBJ3_OESDE|nr:hypothetical protein OESDEN_19058 [Oesophagostomum dentatum]
MGKYGRQYGYCDEIAVSTAIDENSVIKKSMDLRLGVELHGELTRGQVVVDWTGILLGPNQAIIEARVVKDSDKARRHIHVVVDFDVKVVDEWMHNTVRGKRGPW